jgi:exoribonuclease-2
MTALILYPGPGCVVEFLQGNVPHLGIVLEEQGGRLRLYTQGRRETSLPASRLLPWSGPNLGAGLSRAAMDEALERRRQKRSVAAESIEVMEIWSLIQGEVEHATAVWLAGLVGESPDVDDVAALGRALLASKTHFRFSPPDFEIFPESVVTSRLAEAEIVRRREAVVGAGAVFFKNLWEIVRRSRGPLQQRELPTPETADLLKGMLLKHLADPDAPDDEGLWKALLKTLPENPHLPLLLAEAWGLVPVHYNYLFARAGFDPGEDWAVPLAADCAAVVHAAATGTVALEDEGEDAGRLVSIDPETTIDRDDALYVRENPDGTFFVRGAIACPALAWPFGSELDKAVLRRASSLYLPEGDEHMLPHGIGSRLFSLDAGLKRPAVVMEAVLDAAGGLRDFSVRVATVVVAHNFSLERAEAAAQGKDNEAAFFVLSALKAARLLQQRRIAQGAVITERPDPEILLSGSGAETLVDIRTPEPTHLAHLVVGELMILFNAALAEWGNSRGIPLLYRVQDVGLPREFAGVWSAPHEIARIVRSLPPAGLETKPRRHAGLGLSAYVTATSPMRRYVDLLNQGQVLRFLHSGSPVFTERELVELLSLVSVRQDAVGQIQRLRPRYWKLLFFRQRGDKKWWPGEVTEENEYYVTCAMPWAQMFVRGKRNLFGEKVHPGMSVRLRVGKVNPLAGEIQIMEAEEA